MYIYIKTNYFEIQIMTENYHDYIYIYIDMYMHELFRNTKNDYEL